MSPFIPVKNMAQNPDHSNTTDSHAKLKALIQERIHEIRSYVPKIGVFGVTGVGKSSLCNALFGSDVAKISNVAACTREPQSIFIGDENGRGLQLIDVPGVGETIERDVEYFELYKNLIKELDLVIWVIKADDRAYAVAEKAYKEIIKPHEERCPTLFVINQVDKIEPVRDWNEEERKPGERQMESIKQKIIEIGTAFDVSPNYIQTASANERYNLDIVMNTIIDILPNEKKYAVFREAQDDIKTEEAALTAEKGVLDSLKEFVGKAWDGIKEFAQEKLIEHVEVFMAKTLPTVKDSVISILKRWF